MANADDYKEHVLSSLPTWFTRNDRAMENIEAFAELYKQTQDQGEFWHSMSYILQATVDVADWLDQHARDRGTTRQAGELDTTLRGRLRQPDAALIKSSIADAVQGVLDSEGIPGTVGLFEARPNAAFFQTLAPTTGTGGTFAVAGADMQFTPDVQVGNLSTFYDTTASHQIVVSGATSPANDGTFPITDFIGNALEYPNLGVGEVDATAAYSIQRLDASGNLLDGFNQSYLNRGYRTADGIDIIIILPFGCSAGTLAGVEEALRQKAGAGVAALVECRANP